MEAFWLSVGRDRFQTAMQGHFTGLTSKVDQLRAEILANATGRLAAPIVSVVLAPAFLSMFSGWSIMIRYADTGFTPVQQVDCDRWKVDATDLMLNLVVV
ncbi:hypothetical protein A4249_01830 [Brevundimonas sp. GW460-12-10-14-LB2]|nr:hypothetical protein A4249_01830 [Brevundimonas sp. GW460-12-10-14-LB2]